MGAWLRQVWAKALAIADDPKLKDYGPVDVAYGIWNRGGTDSSERANGIVINNVKTYLDDTRKGGYQDKKAKIDIYLNDTYVEAHDALDVRGILHEGGIKAPSHETIGRFIRSHGGLPSGESLMRGKADYAVVHRIEPDGSTRGYFIGE